MQTEMIDRTCEQVHIRTCMVYMAPAENIFCRQAEITWKEGFKGTTERQEHSFSLLYAKVQKTPLLKKGFLFSWAIVFSRYKINSCIILQKQWRQMIRRMITE